MVVVVCVVVFVAAALGLVVDVVNVGPINLTLKFG